MKGWGREGGRGGGEEVTLSVYTNPFSVHLQCFSPTCLHYGDFSVRESVLAFRGREEEEEQEEEEVEACFTCWELGGRVGGWVGWEGGWWSGRSLTAFNHSQRCILPQLD